VIGAGSSGIQIVPALVDKVKAMDHYVRGRTWISNQHGGERVASKTNGQGGNFPYTEEERQKWREDPASYTNYRKELEIEMQTLYAKSQKGSAFQGAGNLLIMMEHIHSYVADILDRMAHDNIGYVEARQTPVDNFTDFAERYFDRTVYSEVCASWYKSSPPTASAEERKRGRVTALWPGSSLHSLKALSKVRWEDFETRPFDGNGFGWFGNGWILDEKTRKMDEDAVTSYLNSTEFLDDIRV
jgi:hypothetical protein